MVGKTFAEWLAERGVGGRAQVAKATGLRWQSVNDIARGVVTPRASTAKAIEAATGGAVSAASLLGLSDTIVISTPGASPAAVDAEPEAAE